MDKDNKDVKDPEYPAELESQFILRLPPEPAKALKEVLKTGENLKNRLTIQFENDMRHGEVQFDQWHMHAKVVDLPTIVDSLKTIDNKNFYKTADIAQMMLCKTDSEPTEPTSTEEETPAKNKKKDSCKVDKKFLWPHGLTPPTKNIRKRRFRKTLRKKFVEAPEIEKEVKRLLRADNEAMSVTWEVINEEDCQQATVEPTASTSYKPEKKTKGKAVRVPKKEKASTAPKPEPSNVEDIFGGALSDSDLEEENIQMEMANCRLSPYKLPKPVPGPCNAQIEQGSHAMEFQSESLSYPESPKPSTSQASTSGIPPSHFQIGGLSSDDESDYQTMRDESKENMTFRINQVKTELDELKQRRQRTQHEIAGMENLALKQRFKDILHTLNQDIMFKDMEYQGLLTLQNSEVI